MTTNPSSGGCSRVVPLKRGATNIVWMPNGSKLLLEAAGARPNARELFWVDPESGQTTPFKVIEPTRNPLFPRFSADGRTINNGSDRGGASGRA